jgi:hypothetical protein
MALIEILIELVFEAVFFSFEFVCRRKSPRSLRPSVERARQVVSERHERRGREPASPEPAARAAAGDAPDERAGGVTER